ncbi:hypothetical protein M409DRAFT_63360 [Zasmidium cellare ATCC 36951]|uniref:Uncharacterized protein n=1 Tax=Zasmidium cellare ATCC 36951 TaxID=1080233 RepID=A0A6A6CX22_ZASCE|nr:uncharacterized protein M409DRAFT_63360 [Zasmidium cellare ATCC 36951]KAF2171767.1 hypothetical protein M409DRAFT_63360 [Zasmidium cellare ATCC 36951]
MTSRQQLLDSHPSLNASMGDFEAHDFSPTVPEYPSQHSGFMDRQSVQTSDYSEATSSRRSYSPPAWRKAGSGWFKNGQLPYQPSRKNSKEASPQQHRQYYREASEEDYNVGDDGDVTAYRTARRIPLPESPVKGRSPSVSPDPVKCGAQEGDKGGGDGGSLQTVKHIKEEEQDDGEVDTPTMRTPTQNNYIRFQTSLDVVQRTEPIEAVVGGVRRAIRNITHSPYHTFLYAIGSIVLYWICISLFSTPANGPSPDLIKVAGLVRSFEPVIYYSEHGHAQIEQLQETGVAVWDLGESVRSTNMTSAPLIVNQLDDLSDSLKTLAIELTRFFASVDADVDSILLVMEWAQRELSTISMEPPSTISSVWSNAHTMLTRVGLMSDSKLAQAVLGQTYQQRTKATMERTFFEFLGVLEESINNELTYSTSLFQLFEAIDKQFLNLQRTVIREQDTQERAENDFLGSLWTKVIGVNASKLRKYEKNKNLLHSVRDRTVRNKHVLVEHNHRLYQVKENLEILRRKLVSPLVRSSNSSTISIDDQIRGLATTYQQLKSSRDAQKHKMMEKLFGDVPRRVSLPGGADHGRSIEGSVTSSATYYS